MLRLTENNSQPLMTKLQWLFAFLEHSQVSWGLMGGECRGSRGMMERRLWSDTLPCIWLEGPASWCKLLSPKLGLARVHGWFSALWDRRGSASLRPLLCPDAQISPISDSRPCSRCCFLICRIWARALPGTPRAVFVLFTVSALVEPKTLGQALCKAPWGPRRGRSHGSCFIELTVWWGRWTCT